jgi:hypothetical protein
VKNAMFEIATKRLWTTQMILFIGHFTKMGIEIYIPPNNWQPQCQMQRIEVSQRSKLFDESIQDCCWLGPAAIKFHCWPELAGLANDAFEVIF